MAPHVCDPWPGNRPGPITHERAYRLFLAYLAAPDLSSTAVRAVLVDMGTCERCTFGVMATQLHIGASIVDSFTPEYKIQMTDQLELHQTLALKQIAADG